MSDSEEERVLEENLFGREFLQRQKRKKQTEGATNELLAEEVEGAGDEPMFFFDAPGLDDALVPVIAASNIASTSKKLLWADPADEAISVSLKSDNLLRKLREDEKEDVVDGKEYEKRLRKKFERDNPKPQWVEEARKRKRGKGEDESEEEEGDEIWLSRTGDVGLQKKRKGTLPEGKIDMERLRDLNQQGYSTADIKRMEFHPSTTLAYTASSDRRLRLFQVDGLANNILATVHFPSLNLTHSSFSSTGGQIFVSGKQPHIYTYDLGKDAVTASPQNMFAGALGGGRRESDSRSIDLFRVGGGESGDIVAVMGKGGYVHLVDTRSWSIVGDLKVPDNYMVKDFIWAKRGKELMVLNGGNNQEIFVFDVAERRARDKWRDEGGFQTRNLALDPSERWLAVGSSTGIVNIYDATSPLTYEGSERKSLKAIGNLVTGISTLSFHPTSSMLAIASSEKKGALKLVHLPSLKVFENWPRKDTPLGRVKDVGWDSKGRWLSVAGGMRAGLWRVKWFGN